MWHGKTDSPPSCLSHGLGVRPTRTLGQFVMDGSGQSDRARALPVSAHRAAWGAGLYSGRNQHTFWVLGQSVSGQLGWHGFGVARHNKTETAWQPGAQLLSLIPNSLIEAWFYAQGILSGTWILLKMTHRELPALCGSSQRRSRGTGRGGQGLYPYESNRKALDLDCPGFESYMCYIASVTLDIILSIIKQGRESTNVSLNL